MRPLADTAHDEQFQTSVADDTSRNFTLTITQVSTGTPLATGILDHSGSGEHYVAGRQRKYGRELDDVGLMQRAPREYTVVFGPRIG